MRAHRTGDRCRQLWAVGQSCACSWAVQSPLMFAEIGFAVQSLAALSSIPCSPSHLALALCSPLHCQLRELTEVFQPPNHLALFCPSSPRH